MESPGSQRRAEGRIAKVPILIGATADEGRTQPNMTNLDAYLNALFPEDSQLRDDIRAAYPLGSPGFETQSDVVGQILTDLTQCSSALYARDTAAAGLKAWRFHLKAYFPNSQLLNPNGRAYHGTQVPLVRGTYNPVGATTQEVALSKYMQKAWADFAKDPYAGPGWSMIGTNGGVDLGVLGANGSIGVTVIPEEEVDTNCRKYDEFFSQLGL